MSSRWNQKTKYGGEQTGNIRNVNGTELQMLQNNISLENIIEKTLMGGERTCKYRCAGAVSNDWLNIP